MITHESFIMYTRSMQVQDACQRKEVFNMKHCILVKFREDVEDDERKDLLPDIRLLFERLTALDGIHGVEVIPNVIDRPNRYDLLIRIDMDREALSAYDKSEPHLEWKTEYAAYLEKKAIFDYEE